MTEPRREHYSYTMYADERMARTFDDRRFGGPIGDLVAATQARVLAEFVGPARGRTVLDVGTGTGRAALLLARDGALVTGVDASEQMLGVARERASSENLRVEFRVGDAHALEFADRAFDVAISLRVLMHTPEWRTCIGELCRVARDAVVFDFPSATSAAALESIARRVTHAGGARTEAYRVFRYSTMRRELKRHGFDVRAVHRQFVLPIAIHKTIGSRRFTRIVEGLFERAGLLRVLGSPVTVLAERCGS